MSFANYWQDWYVEEEISPGKKIYYQFFNLIEIYRKIFVSLFDQIYFNANFKKKNEDGKKIPIELHRVPIHFTTKHKMIQDWRKKTIDSGDAVVRPVIGIYPTSLEYVADKQKSNILKMMDEQYINPYRAMQSNGVYRGIIPKHYVQNYKVIIATEKMNVQDQILEQILPQLNPSVAIDINIPLLKKYTTRIEMTGFDLENEFQNDFENERIIMSSLNFTQSMILFPPIREESMIREVRSKLDIANFDKECFKDFEYDH